MWHISSEILQGFKYIYINIKATQNQGSLWENRLIEVNYFDWVMLKYQNKIIFECKFY